MTSRRNLPGPIELALLWSAHIAAMAILYQKGYASCPVLVGTALVAMIAFLTGARVERYRAELQRRAEDDDGYN